MTDDAQQPADAPADGSAADPSLEEVIRTIYEEANQEERA